MGRGTFYIGSVAGLMLGVVAGTLISNKMYGVPKVDVRVPEQAGVSVKTL